MQTERCSSGVGHGNNRECVLTLPGASTEADLHNALNVAGVGVLPKH